MKVVVEENFIKGVTVLSLAKPELKPEPDYYDEIIEE